MGYGKNDFREFYYFLLNADWLVKLRREKSVFSNRVGRKKNYQIQF